MHKPELCEACKKFGDCSGFFADPFIAFMALTDQLEDVARCRQGGSTGHMDRLRRAASLLHHWSGGLRFHPSLKDIIQDCCGIAWSDPERPKEWAAKVRAQDRRWAA